ncbi:MAG: ATP-binding protein [Chitinispirillia bacterium]|nr:ATP-binding protein [Chitinispirillia bacterium]
MQFDVQILARIIEHAPTCILLLEKDGVIVYANLHGQKFFGFSKDELAGKPLSFLPDFYDKLSAHDSTLKSVIDGTLKNSKITCGSSNKVCMMNSIKIGGVGPDQDLTALVIKDITEEEVLHEQIEKKELEIAKMNAELIRSKAELKKLSSLKSNFLSIASHELNTPLTSIKGYSDIIIDNMREKIEPSVFRMIESISRAADRLHKVVNNMLDVTKIEQNRLRLHPEPVDIGAICKDCVEEISQLAAKRKITFICGIASDLPMFNGDRARLYQVFTNLFSNAIKYSPDGSSVNVSIAVKHGNRFHIIVKDRGIGIDEEEHKNIFHPFYEVGSSNRHSTDFTKFMGGGSGLGLSIAKGVVERHGGKIWVESAGAEKGNFPGSEFHILLPLHANITWDDDDTKSNGTKRLLEADAAFSESRDSTSQQEQVKPKVLFIDPDKEGVEIASMILEDVFDIITAPNGEQGLKLAFHQAPALILMDAHLPGLDSWRVCRILRSQEETRDIPIAFFSDNAKDDEVKRSFESGANDFIVKPFSPKELVEKIWRLLMDKQEEETFR